MPEVGSQSRLEEAAAYEFPSLSELKNAHLKLLELETSAADGESATPAFRGQVREFMLRASATGRILEDDKERGVAQTLINYWATVLIRAGEENVPRTSLADSVEDPSRDLDESQCPYCGPHAYSEDTAHLFFGRKQVVEKWLGILRKEKLLVVLGSSGSGKTSLVQAGLLPAIRNGRLESANWEIISRTFHAEKSVEQLVGSGEAKSQNRPTLLVVNHFDEELLSSDRKTKPKLISDFREWLTALNSERKAVLVGRLESAALVRQWLQEGQLTGMSAVEFVPPLDARDLRAVVEGPAEKIGLRFEEGLVDTLVNQLLGDPAALALMQFTLLQLWDRRVRNRITWTAFHEIGGAQGAVETAAESVYNMPGSDPGDHELVRKLFLRLAQPTLGGALTVNSVRDCGPGDNRRSSKTFGKNR